MVRRRVEGGEVVEAVFEFRTLDDGEAEAAEDARGLVDDARERMLHAEAEPAAGEREVGLDAGRGRTAAEALLGGREGGLDFGLPRLDGLAERGALLLRHVLHRLDQRGDGPVAPDVFHAQGLRRGGVGRGGDFLQTPGFRRVKFSKRHFSCLLLETVAAYYTKKSPALQGGRASF